MPQILDPSEIFSLLPNSKSVRIQHPSGDLFTICSPREAAQFVNRSMVAAVVKVIKEVVYFRYLVLTISEHQARKVLRATMRPAISAQANKTVSRVSKPGISYFEHNNRISFSYQGGPIRIGICNAVEPVGR